MILRFCSGSVTPARRVEEQVGRVDEVERQLQLLAKRVEDLRRFVQAQQAVVHEDAREPVADGAVDQHRGDRRIDAARRARRRRGRSPTCARMRAVASSMNDAIVQSPVQPQTSKAKLPQDLDAAVGVRDLGMEQQRVEAAIRRFHGGDRRVGAGRDDREARRRGRDEVAVARPDAQLAGNAAETARASRRRCTLHQRVAELAMRRRRDAAAQHVGHQLHAVADAEHGHAQSKTAGSHFGAPSSRHALRPAREDDAHGLARAQHRRAGVLNGRISE